MCLPALEQGSNNLITMTIQFTGYPCFSINSMPYTIRMFNDALPFVYFTFLLTTDVTLGAIGIWLGTRKGAGGTSTLAQNFFGRSPKLHEQQVVTSAFS